MGLIFKRDHIELILSGVKTQTRRRHKRTLKAVKIYDIKKDWLQGQKTKVYRQRLRDITPEEALKEGGYAVEEFKQVWIRINGYWDPDEVVVVYEFKAVDPPRPNSLKSCFFSRAAKSAFTHLTFRISLF